MNKLRAQQGAGHKGVVTMTKSELISQITGLAISIGDGDQYTVPATRANVTGLFSIFGDEAAAGISFYADLPDGRWLTTINRIGSGYYWTIPDGR